MNNSAPRLFRNVALSSLAGLMLHSMVVMRLFALQVPEDKNIQDVRVRIHRQHITLAQAFQFIEQQTDFKFFYLKEDVPLDTFVEVSTQEESLYQLLQGFATEFDLAFSRINNQIVVKKSDTRSAPILESGGNVCDARRMSRSSVRISW